MFPVLLYYRRQSTQGIDRTTTGMTETGDVIALGTGTTNVIATGTSIFIGMGSGIGVAADRGRDFKHGPRIAESSKGSRELLATGASHPWGAPTVLMH